MSSQNIESIKTIFKDRLTTLEHLLNSAQKHFNGSESFLQERIAADMFPLGTQVAFTCNQPRNFTLWCEQASGQFRSGSAVSGAGIRTYNEY